MNSYHYFITISQLEDTNGLSSVSILFDQEIPISFPLTKIVTSKYLGKFRESKTVECDYQTAEMLDNRSVLAVLAGVRSNGWNFMGTNAVKSGGYTLKTFYFEIVQEMPLAASLPVVKQIHRDVSHKNHYTTVSTLASSSVSPRTSSQKCYVDAESKSESDTISVTEPDVYSGVLYSVANNTNISITSSSKKQISPNGYTRDGVQIVITLQRGRLRTYNHQRTLLAEVYLQGYRPVMESDRLTIQLLPPLTPTDFDTNKSVKAQSGVIIFENRDFESPGGRPTREWLLRFLQHTEYARLRGSPESPPRVIDIYPAQQESCSYKAQSQFSSSRMSQLNKPVEIVHVTHEVSKKGVTFESPQRTAESCKHLDESQSANSTGCNISPKFCPHFSNVLSPPSRPQHSTVVSPFDQSPSTAANSPTSVSKPPSTEKKSLSRWREASSRLMHFAGRIALITNQSHNQPNRLQSNSGDIVNSPADKVSVSSISIELSPESPHYDPLVDSKVEIVPEDDGEEIASSHDTVTDRGNSTCPSPFLTATKVREELEKLSPSSVTPKEREKHESSQAQPNVYDDGEPNFCLKFNDTSGEVEQRSSVVCVEVHGSNLKEYRL